MVGFEVDVVQLLVECVVSVVPEQRALYSSLRERKMVDSKMCSQLEGDLQ
jgi:hypothetical protein